MHTSDSGHTQAMAMCWPWAMLVDYPEQVQRQASKRKPSTHIFCCQAVRVTSSKNLTIFIGKG